MIKNVIFDVDGVIRILKDAKITDLLPSDMLKKYNGAYDNMTMREYFKKYVHSSCVFTIYDRGLITNREMISTNCDLFGENLEIMDNLLAESCKPSRNIIIEQTMNLIKKLKACGYNVYILSNMGKEKAEMLRSVLDTSLFDDIIFSCDVGLVKPEFQMYKYALKRFNVRAEESLFIDDRDENLFPFRCLGGNTFKFVLNDLDTTLYQIEKLLLGDLETAIETKISFVPAVSY